MKLIVGISGASGVLLGYRFLQTLKNMSDIETHLVISEGAAINFKLETNLKKEDIEYYADYVYSNKNLAAAISSGSFAADAMVIIPCSMKTVAGVAAGYAENLLQRAADVCLKESRKVIIVPREMPLNRIHLKNLLFLNECGCVIIPPMLTFYNAPQTMDDQINHIIGKVLSQLNINYCDFKRWNGVEL